MVNIKDVAKACNVSIATASRALRNIGYVNKEKREMIIKKANEMGYIVDNNAQTLKKGKSMTIGVIVSDIENFFYNMVLQNLITEFAKYNYRVIISYSFEDETIERDCIKFLLSSKVDALIFTPISNTNKDLIDLMRKRNMPLLQLFRQAYSEIDAICVDDGYGAYIATKHFLDKNLKKIMLLSVRLPFTPSRSKGYKQAMSEKSIPIDENLIQRFPLGKTIEPKIIELIEKLHPDAIIAGTNTFGLDTIEAMRKLNIQIPLIVFDNLDWLKLLEISTIAQPIKEIHEQTVDNIISKLSHKHYVSPDNGINIRIRPELIIRKSA